MISKKAVNVRLEPIDLKLGQLHSLMHIIQNALEANDNGMLDKDVANLMEVGKDITNFCQKTISGIDD